MSGNNTSGHTIIAVPPDVAKRLLAQGRAIEKKAEAGISKLTLDIIAIVGILLAAIAFGFAIWAAWWAIQANKRGEAQAQQFATHTDQFLQQIESQTSRIDSLVTRLDQVLPPAPQTSPL